MVPWRSTALRAAGAAAVLATATSDDEVNYCAQVEEDTGWYGSDIRWANKTNHWFPATISTCCGSCYNQLQLVPGGTPCAAWTWGHNNNKDCHKQDFKEGEGCCWPKSKAESSTPSGPVPHPTKSNGQVSGICSDLHSGGIPTHSFLDTGWALVIACLLVGLMYMGGGLYLGRKRGLRTHVHVVQLRELYGLVVDGLAFASGKSRRHDPPTSGSSGEQLLPATDASTAPSSTASSSQAKPGAVARSPVRQAARGKPNALHLAASTGDAARIRAILQESNGGGGAAAEQGLLNAGDERRYTPFAVSCSGGHVDCVQLLLSAGCDTTLACDTNLTGLELSQQLKRTAVTRLLLESADSGSAKKKSPAKGRKKQAGQKRGTKREAGAQQPRESSVML